MRYLVVILALVAVVGGLVYVKYAQIASLISFGKQMEKAGPPPESVGTAIAKTEGWEGNLTAIGSITAVKGVTVSNDAPGVVTAIHFESGTKVKQGDVLVELDSNVERAQIASAASRRSLAQVTLDRSRALVDAGAIPQAQLDADQAQLNAATTDLGALQAQVAKKVVRAPFSGRLGIRSVNLGQYLNPGSPITALEAIDAVFVDFSLPQQSLGVVRVGMPVRITLDPSVSGRVSAPTTDAGANSEKFVSAEGAIVAVDAAVDATTRTIKIRANVPNDKEQLRPGMFANVTVLLPKQGEVVTIPATAVIHASFGDSVYIVEDKPGAPPAPDGKPVKTAKQAFVKTGEARGDFVAVTDGVKNGQEVVSEGAFKLRNGAPIVIDNTVKAKPSLDPRPQNR